jgi:hypothetical protein
MRRLSLLTAMPVAALIVGLGSTPTLASTPATTPAPAVTVTPNTGLADGDSVTVNGTNFPATTSIYVLECSGPNDPGDCDLAHLANPTTAADGSFSISFTVHTGAIGAGSCATTSTNCFIGASTSDGTSTAQATLSFGTATPTMTVTPRTGLQASQSVKVVGAHFPSDLKLYILQCSNHTGSTGCDLGTFKNVNTSAGGSFTLSFAVHTGTVGNGTCEAGRANCFVAATSQDGKTSVQVTITFAAAKKLKTVTTASYAARSHELNGRVSSAGKGVKGLTTILERQRGASWIKIHTYVSKAGGYVSAKISKSGRYRYLTPAQGRYAGSHSGGVSAIA